MTTSPQEKIEAIRLWALDNYLNPMKRINIERAEAYLTEHGVISPYHDDNLKEIYRFIHRDQTYHEPKGYSPLFPDQQVIRAKPPEISIPEDVESMARKLLPLIEQAEEDRKKCIAVATGILKDELEATSVEEFLSNENKILWQMYCRLTDPKCGK